jgi:integrase
MTDLLPVTIPPTGVDVALNKLEDEARGYVTASRAASTVRAYSSDWRAFTAWCAAHGLDALPAQPTTVALFITDLARTAKAATIRRRMASISVAHQAAGYANPTSDILVRSTMSGINRTNGVGQVGKSALLTDDIRAMVATLTDNLLGRRDACLLLLGFASAMRRSELVALDVGDVTETNDGLVVTVRKSKTDQEGEGREIGIPYGSNPITCPVRAFRAWLDRSQIEAGPLFRPINRHGQLGKARLSDRAVALVVKRTALAAGLDPKLVAGHSLRSGMATSAARAGATEAEIMNQTGHRSLPVLRRYIRRGSLFTENAAARLGL